MTTYSSTVRVAKPSRRARPPAYRTGLVLLSSVLVALGGVVILREVAGTDTGPCPAPAPSAAPSDSPLGWQRLYNEDFCTAAPVGSFRSEPSGDWRLEAGNPYAASLRSYPDGWGTTNDYSVNYASRTVDVVPTLLDARGVFRLSAQGGEVSGRRQGMAGSFFPVIHPEAADDRAQTSQVYGRYSVRFRTQGGYRRSVTDGLPRDLEEPRYGTAFLLWPSNDQWPEGEVNFPESDWGDHIRGYVHTIGDPEVNAEEFALPETTDDGWHTATIEWIPGRLDFYLDGRRVRQVTHNVPTTPMRWGFQSGGSKGVVSPDLRGTLLVDWVTIDAWSGTVPPAPT